MTRAVLGLATVLGALFPAASFAATELELGTTYDRLSAPYADWTSQYLEGSHTFGPRQTLYGRVQQTQRFGLADQEVTLGGYYPLAPGWTLLTEGSLSPSHNVLSVWSLLGQCEIELGQGWVGHLGLRRTAYSANGNTREILGLERYWSRFRGAYTLSLNQVDVGGTPASHQFQLSYYYGERNTLGLTYAFGQEVEPIGGSLLVSDVRAFVLSGRHWFLPGWAIAADLGWTEQGQLYQRQGFRLGLRHLF
ncbi:YaiO family outer membrane beta-barrel protein [bacterium]|nr:YaiO family outer membrane beta-barrel protein [bacterium]